MECASTGALGPRARFASCAEEDVQMAKRPDLSGLVCYYASSNAVAAVKWPFVLLVALSVSHEHLDTSPPRLSRPRGQKNSTHIVRRRPAQLIASTTLESETNFFTRDEPRRPGRDGLVDGLCTRGTCFSGAAASSNTPATLASNSEASRQSTSVAWMPFSATRAEKVCLAVEYVIFCLMGALSGQ